MFMFLYAPLGAFSTNWPTGPIRSSNRDVSLFVVCCLLCVLPFPCDFLAGTESAFLLGPSPHCRMDQVRIFAWTKSVFSQGPSSLFGGDRARMGLSSGAIKTGLCSG